MKKLIFLIFLTVTSLQSAMAQTSIAKLKFEEAEEAYASNNFELTLTKLDEAEKILKSTNPKILYLKILAQVNIIKSDPYKDFAILENAKKLSAKYLNEYDNLPNNEDKFRDIYKISGELKKYPNTIQEFNLQKKQFIADEESRKSNETLTKQNAEDAFKSFVFYSDFKIGLSLEDTYNLYPVYKKSYKVDYKVKNEKGFLISPKKATGQYEPSALIVVNNIVCGYAITFYSLKVDDAQYSIITKSTTGILERLNNKFLFNPTESVTENHSLVSGKDFYTKAITYTWLKNNKTITLSVMKSTYLGENLSSLTLSSIDEDLIK